MDCITQQEIDRLMSIIHSILNSNISDNQKDNLIQHLEDKIRNLKKLN